MVTLIQLEYVVAVDTYRHFATAAEHCHITQPTLSMQIKKLEESLGVVIFDRSRHPVVPTEIGLAIIDQARVVLREAGHIQELIRQHQQEVSGELRLGIIPTLSPFLMPLFAGPMTKKYPKLRLVVLEMLTEDMVHALRTDQLDVGILVTPVQDETLYTQPLFTEEILVYCHPEHPLAAWEKVPVTELAAEGLWLLSKGHCFRSQVINLCTYYSEQHAHSPIIYESSSLETLIRMVETEGGFTLLPELAAKSFSEERKGRIRQIEGVPPVRQVSMAYTRSYAKKRLLTLMAEQINLAVPEQMRDRDHVKVVEWS